MLADVARVVHFARLVLDSRRPGPSTRRQQKADVLIETPSRTHVTRSINGPWEALGAETADFITLPTVVEAMERHPIEALEKSRGMREGGHATRQPRTDHATMIWLSGYRVYSTHMRVKALNSPILDFMILLAAGIHFHSDASRRFRTADSDSSADVEGARIETARPGQVDYGLITDDEI
ncbi:uncharacterized protein MYCFIDRAFT_169958 [Pseudocercospora fijiensis CIRAD86]|uniref:Uncharacterized protein n=1 Tax=Pseudocercospora fijiensis (strain CIRAD86) TaxID=383855 RepID=N1QB71_PSEFD|nr:uncharacterized protein MYCFIDRAFT_169958 [Pseudocercospora fijiensis CIRAD86]EME88328.1 hypothetical protein MYCFIDRAFT_169958 [Pseudocercospora fijiensis CIRAD86]